MKKPKISFKTIINNNKLTDYCSSCNSKLYKEGRMIYCKNSNCKEFMIDGGG